MAVFYKLYQEKRTGSKNQGKWYARAKMTNTVSLQQLAQEIESNVSVKESDVYAVLIELVNVMKRELQNSHSVKLDRLGIFSAGITTKPAATTDTFTPEKHIVGTHINFRPEQKYLSGRGKGKRATTMMLSGVKLSALPKNAVEDAEEEAENND
ncbi:MAG: HU family DNA-binding protein [Prevotella sp.]|nr:HU family DNA-binding protein [Prevotella sp.]